MPNTPIAIDETNAESINKTRMEINRELKALTPGKAVLGAIGVQRVAETFDEKEVLNDKDKENKKKIQDLFLKYIEPPILSEIKPNPAKDRASFVKKVERQTLGELRRFWAGKIPEELSEEEVSELNRKWADISP
uniref:Uncharacterized protein n=1 Tax=viral metagenome TaxID=1070528 RepID=A0A6M3L3Q3_9ZZZZ